MHIPSKDDPPMRLKYLRVKARSRTHSPTAGPAAGSPCAAELQALIGCWRHFGVDAEGCAEASKLLTNCAAQMGRTGKTAGDQLGTINHMLSRYFRLRQLPK